MATYDIHIVSLLKKVLDKVAFCQACFSTWEQPISELCLPLSQNESSCKTFHLKMILICMKMNL